ncbi:MAG: AAA family ATPase, partial [Clostridiales bacterium]|nr:AAA family ATPase [Clostridiales bacterium]
AAARYLLRLQANKGDTYAEFPALIRGVREFLAYAPEYEAVASAIMNGFINDGLEGCVVDKCGTKYSVYLKSLYWNEVNTTNAIRRLMRTARPVDCNPEELCAYAEKICGVKYAEQQREAFQLLKTGGVGIITGGPGTGKTTVIKGLLAAYQKMFPDRVIKLCAPTGRASQRMKEATGREATTIHRLLEYKPFENTATYKNGANPIDADFLFVDEGSMISIDVADLLFSAIRSGTTVLIAGDIDQLPSVGTGNVLNDLIESGVIPVIALKKTHRQAEGSVIIDNAKKIREGYSNLSACDDFEIFVRDDDEIPDVIEEQFLKYYKTEDVFSAQVLVPARKRQGTGAKDINKRLQAIINTSSKGLTYSDTTFKTGDKVMLMRNNYTAEDAYFNGDVGVVLSTDETGLDLLIDGQKIRIDESQLNDVSLAYATTIHKSQGSEYDVAICVMPSEPSIMLQRNLLYTAITRAKKKVILIAAPNAIDRAVFTRDSVKRQSLLVDRLQGKK